MITEPMKAPREPKLDFATLQYPIYASFKEDGIRGLTLPPPNQNHLSRPVSRSFKPIRNKYVHDILRDYVPPYLDGEIVIPGKSFNDTQSAVMSIEGTPGFQFRVFDSFARPDYPFIFRWNDARKAVKQLDDHSILTWVEQFKCHSPDEVQSLHEMACRANKEGLVLRTPTGIYKSGRCTEREGIMWKVVTFVREEATIIGFEQMKQNCNVATSDEFGRSKRSKHEANMVLLPRLGAFIVNSDKYPCAFKVGNFTEANSIEFWQNRDNLRAQTITFKHKPHGMKDLPRNPSFVGLRHADDL